MDTIHKIAAMVIENDKFLMVRKFEKDIWTSLGGRIEAGETEEEALEREIEEELSCGSKIIRKIGDFKAVAVFDEGIDLKLSVYLTELTGDPQLIDPELEEFAFIGKDYKEKGIQLPPSIENEVIPQCLKEGLLKWGNK